MAEILANPNVMKAAQAELDEVIGRNRLVQESDIPKLKYIQAIVKESLRLHPPVPLLVPHQSIDTCKVSGYDIPAGTMLFVNVWAIGRDATIWEEPLRFNPNRFVEGGTSADVGMLGQNFQFLPFGAGRRACPGMAMGSLMVQSSIANLLHAFDWSLPFDMEPHDLDMSEGVGFTCPRAVPLHALAKRRLPTELYKGTTVLKGQ
jgi:cytochrome P450